VLKEGAALLPPNMLGVLDPKMEGLEVPNMEGVLLPKAGAELAGGAALAPKPPKPPNPPACVCMSYVTH